MDELSTGASSAPEVAVPAASEPSLRDQIASRLSGSPPPTPTAPAPTVEQAADIKPAEATQPAAAGQPAAPAVEDPDGVVDDFEIDLDGQKPDDLKPESAEAETEAAQPGDLTKEEADREIGKLLATPRGRRIYSAHKAMQQLALPEEPDGKGGIGHVPTVEQTKEYFANHLGMQRLIADFGDPSQHVKIAEYFFGQGSTPEIAATFLQRLPDHLAATNPQLLPALANPIGEGLAHHIRSLVSQYDEAGKARLRDAADILDMIQGRNPPAQPGQQQEGQENPEVLRLRQQLQQMTEAQRRGQQTAAQQNAQQFRSALFQKVGSQLTADVDAALAIVKGKVDDVTFEAYKSRLTEEMRSTIRAARQPVEAIRLKVESAIARGASQQDIDAMTREYRRIWANKLTDSRGAYIKAAGVRVKDSNSAVTDKLQQAQTKTEPAATGARPPDHSAPIERREGESADQFRERAIQSRLSALA